MSNYDLDGKVILITGAAGGIGAATARALYAAGARLVLTDLRQADVDKLAVELGDAASRQQRLLAMALDVADLAACKAAVAHAVEHFGRLDVVFANAGISWRAEPATMLSCDEAEFERIVAVDFLGVWRIVKAALPEIARHQGQVLVTSSIYAFMNGAVNAPYAASKAAIEMLARSLHAELGSCGASAAVLYPGWVSTPIARVAFGGHDLATRMMEQGFPAPLRQPVPPERVASAVVRGLRKRQARIVVPGRWWPLLWLRGLLAPLMDGYLRRHRGIQPLMRELEQRQTAPRN